MCFYISQDPYEQRVKVAEKDIVCYKFGSKVKLKGKTVFKAPCYRFFYSKDTTYRIKTKRLRPRSDQINTGFHSYSVKTDAADCCCSALDDAVGRFIIPKGARYYENSEIRELVSDSIIFKNFVKV